jgi:pimeloyl-ACP methyl ester carboxylesterase
MNTPFIRDGLRLNAFIAEGEGERIIFQHGLCGSATQTREAFPTDPRYKIATLECRGHGGSESGNPDHFSISTFADDVASTLFSPFTGENESQCIFGGISMGAAIALRIAVHKPHLVKALVLARPAWFIDAAPENMNPNLEVGELLQAHFPDQAEAKFLLSSTAKHLARIAPENLTSLKSFFTREPIATTSALLRSISVDGPSITMDDLANIKVPTLIIATEQDFIHPMVQAEALHAAIPNSRLACITPKAVDKSRYVSEFHSTLLKFFETVNAKPH